MKHSILLIVPVFLVACSGGPSQGVSHDFLMENPLFAERYAEELVDRVVELKIQNDPLLEDASKADVVEKTRTMWLDKGRKARKLQREGMEGGMISIAEYVRGSVLYLNAVLYFGPSFETVPGPNVHVYLTTEVDPRDIEFPDASALDLGSMTSPYGAQRYAVPPQENPLLYRTAVLWDNDLERLNGFAQLSQ